VRIAPVVNSFTLNKYAGKNTELIFNFSITANGGKNIFWSILREGSKTPLFSGNSLQTVNGVSTVGNVSTMLNHFISKTSYKRRSGYSFTLVVVYDLTEDGSRLDEKILNTAVYKVSNQQAVTGFLTATQQRLVLLVHTILGVSYTLIVDQTI
jgi:hypothetical protein